MAKTKTKTRRDEMVTLLALRDREGLTFRELSARCGVPAATLNWWSWRLRREAQPAFTELSVVDDDASGEGATGVRLRIGELVLEVDRDFHPEVLGRVLDVVRSRC